MAPLKVGQEIPDLLASARILLAAKRAKEAETLYLKALGMQPKNPQINYNLGVLYGDYLKDPRKASKYYRKYIELAPRAPDVAAVRAWILDLDARSR